MHMKTRATHPRLILITGALAVLPACLTLAADSSTGTTQTAGTVAPVAAPVAAQPKLPYGVADILKLSQAQVGDDIIVNYVKNSGTIYNLAPADIVYLKNSGVSDRVLNSMLDQRKLADAAAAAQASAQSAAASSAAAMAAAPTGAEADYSAGYPAPGDTTVQAPLTPPASTVTVVPYPAATAAYYGYYYPYYYGPSVSVAFGIGGGYYGYGHYGHGYYGHGYYGHGSYAIHGGHGGGHGGGGHGGGGHH